MLTEIGELVRSLGRQLLDWRDGKAIGGHWDGAQLKTEADLMAHAFLHAGLANINSDIPVVSEEDEASKTSERPSRYWLIDPIDGTASFAQGYNGFVTQIALIDAERPVLSAVFAPVFNQLYLAEAGRGATVNGRQLNVSMQPDRRVLIDNYPSPRGIAADIFADLHCTSYFECGSISLKICRVADGSADIFVKDVAVRDWDIAAPALIIAEASGWLSNPDGKPYAFCGSWEKTGILASSNARLASAVIEQLRMRNEG